MKILECKGNDYSIGLQIGTYFRDILRKHASAFENALQEAETAEHIQKELQILKEEMPGIYDELRGRSGGAGLSIEMITLMSSLEITSRSSGCTTVIVKQPDGRILFSHNEDEDDFTADNSAVLVYHYDDLDVYAYTNAWKLPGSADGWNSAGMVFTSNYLFYEKADFSRLSRYIACKAVYHSRTLEEAIEAVKQLKTASPFSINILDTNIQRAVNIEKDLDACYITEITGKFSRSNHFLNREAKSSVSSDYRLNKTRELLAQKEITRLKDVMDILDTIGTDEDHTVHIPASIETHGMTVINLAVDSSRKTITIRNFLDNSLTQFRL